MWIQFFAEYAPDLLSACWVSWSFAQWKSKWSCAHTFHVLCRIWVKFRIRGLHVVPWAYMSCFNWPMKGRTFLADVKILHLRVCSETVWHFESTPCKNLCRVFTSWRMPFPYIVFYPFSCLPFIEYQCPFLGAFAYLRKTAVTFVTSVCPAAWNSFAPAGQIFLKLCLEGEG